MNLLFRISRAKTRLYCRKKLISSKEEYTSFLKKCADDYKPQVLTVVDNTVKCKAKQSELFCVIPEHSNLGRKYGFPYSDELTDKENAFAIMNYLTKHTYYCGATRNILPDDGMEIPSSASWSDGATLAYSGGRDAARFSISGSLEEDNVIFARAVTVHDSNENPSAPAVALIAKLKAPTLNSVSYGSDNLIEVQASHNSSVPDSFIAVEYHDMDNVNRSYIAGIMPHGQTSVQIQCPAWDDSAHVSIGVFETVANVSSDTREDGSTVYTLTPFYGRQT